MGYFGDVLVSIDQLGNTFAGGNPDNTISSRIGYYVYHKDGNQSKKLTYWNFMRQFIDFTFYPVDGWEHCHNAYHNDAGELFDDDAKDWAIVLLSIIIIGTCIPISVVFYLLLLLKVVSAKKINRAEKIADRLKIVSSKMHGISNELEEFPIEDLDNVPRLQEKVPELDEKCKHLIIQILRIPNQGNSPKKN